MSDADYKVVRRYRAVHSRISTEALAHAYLTTVRGG